MSERTTAEITQVMHEVMDVLKHLLGDDADR